MAIPRERIETGRLIVIHPRPEGAVYHAYQILLFGFLIAPVIAGVDKFFHVLVNWDQYLHPALPRLLGIEPQVFMLGVGVVEIVAGLVVALKASIGGWLVAAWLWAIIVNLLAIPAYFDIALRDFGLSLGAMALARLASHFESLRED